APPPGRRPHRTGRRELGSTAPPTRRLPERWADEICYPASTYGPGRRIHRPVRRRAGRPRELERLDPAQNVRRRLVGDVVELGVLLDEIGDRRADRDDPFAVGAGRRESFADHDAGQAASAEFFVDLGVVENPLVTTVGEGRE